MKQQAGLKQLQNQLKKEFLLIERENRQKMKIKKQIHDNVEKYFSILIEKRRKGKLLTDDRLGNSYNFVKDLFLALAKDVECGIQILLKTQQSIVRELAKLFFHTIYENFTELDQYNNKIIKFCYIFSKKIAMSLNSIIVQNEEQQITIKSLSPNLQQILQQYLNQDDIVQYFQMLSNNALNQIPLFEAKLSNRWSVIHMPQQFVRPDLNTNNSISFQNSDSFVSSEIQVEKKMEKIIDDYVHDICSKAQLVPLTLKVLCFVLKKELKYSNSTKTNLIWRIISGQLLRSLDVEPHKNRWNHFSNVSFCNYVERIKVETLHRFKDPLLVSKFIQKCSNINENRLNNCVSHEKIEVYGGCISYKQLYLLFQTINQNYEQVKKLNERIGNRIKKIYDVSPQFKMFLQFPNASNSYIIFTDIVYGKLIEKDYYKLYNQSYDDQMIKKMIKQILSTSDFRIIAQIQSGLTLTQILQKSIDSADLASQQANEGVFAHSSQFIMKMKYLSYLIKKEKISEQSIIQQLIQQCKKRQSVFIETFQQSKLVLLQALTSINKSCKILNSKTQLTSRIQKHLKLVKILDKMELNLCITAPSTRPNNFKFTSSESESIIIEKASQCCHQQNIIQGLKSHASSISQAINIFCDLKEVKQAMSTGNDFAGIYEGLQKMKQSIKQDFRKNSLINFQQYDFFQKSLSKIIFRVLHQKLIEMQDRSFKDQEFQQKLKNLSFISSHKIKVGEYNFDQLQQVWQIVCRYFKNFLHVKKTPIQKIQLMKEATQILKMALNKYDKNLKMNSQILQIMLAYTLIRSRLKKFLSHIHYTEIFSSKQMLVKSQGVTLNRMKNAISLINDERIKQFIIIQDRDFKQKMNDKKTESFIENIKADQKLQNSVIYI